MIPSIQDIYLMRVYFKGVSGDFKVRPVLIIDFDEELLLFTIVEITSVPQKIPPGHYDKFKEPITNWQESGLDEPSYVKCTNIHRVEPKRLHKKIGSLNTLDFNNIIEKITFYNS
jgi:mRNA interferase MazF